MLCFRLNFLLINKHISTQVFLISLIFIYTSKIWAKIFACKIWKKFMKKWWLAEGLPTSIFATWNPWGLQLNWSIGWSNPLRWRHNERDCVSNHQPHDCLLNRLFRRRSRKTSKLRVTGLCAENSPWTGEFPAQMANRAESVSILWRHNALKVFVFKSKWQTVQCISSDWIAI